MNAVDSPKISVIMSVYNDEKYLRKAIESILNQTFADFEFIIVNDGSTDRSLKIIQNYKDIRIRIINNMRNIGLTKSLNKALRIAEGGYIARQDADDISLPNRLEAQLRYFQEHPEIALLGTGAYIIDETGTISGREIPLANPSKNDFTKDNQIVHGSAMFRKAIIDVLGPYNELYKYSQDYELWLRIATCHNVANLTFPLYKKRKYSESVQAMKRKEGALYHLLALKRSENSLDDEVVKIVDDKGISNLYPYLSNKEKIYLHKSVARACIGNGDLRSARQEYKIALSLYPFDIRTIINFLLTYLGKGIMDKIAKIHLFFRLLFRRDKS